MLATPEFAVRGPIIPELAHANFRAIEGTRNPVLQSAEVRVPRKLARRAATPGAQSVRIGQVTEKLLLAFPRQITEGATIPRHRFAIKISQALQKLTLCLRRLGGEQPVNKAIRQRFLSAGSIRLGDDQVAQRDQRLVLMLV